MSWNFTHSCLCAFMPRDRDASTLQTRCRAATKCMIAVDVGVDTIPPPTTLPHGDHPPICQQITSEKNPLNRCFSVLALLPQMTREIQDQQPTAARQYSSYRTAHHTSALECECNLGEGKANRNIRISEIEPCSRKHATKQFSNRNKNAFFALLKGREMGEKHS